MDKSAILDGKAYNKFVSGVGDGHQGDSYNVVYAMIGEGDKLLTTNYHTCLGKLNHYEDHFSYNLAPEALLIQVQNGLTPKFNRYHIYYEWLFNHSPWRSAFITKDVSSVMDSRVIVLDTDVNANLMAGAGIACRHPWEFYDSWGPTVRAKMELWLRLVNEGNDPTVAFVFANQMGLNTSSSYSLDIKEVDTKDWYLSTYAVGHQSLSSEKSSMNVHANFIEEIITETETYRERTSYDGPSDAFEDSRETTIIFHSWLNKHMLGGTKKQSNPFSKTSETNYYKLPYVLEAFKELIPKFKNYVEEAA